MMTSLHGHTEIVRAILETGGYKVDIEYESKLGMTALQMAQSEQHTEIAQLLGLVLDFRRSQQQAGGGVVVGVVGSGGGGGVRYARHCDGIRLRQRRVFGRQAAARADRFKFVRALGATRGPKRIRVIVRTFVAVNARLTAKSVGEFSQIAFLALYRPT